MATVVFFAEKAAWDHQYGSFGRTKNDHKWGRWHPLQKKMEPMNTILQYAWSVGPGAFQGALSGLSVPSKPGIWTQKMFWIDGSFQASFMITKWYMTGLKTNRHVPFFIGKVTGKDDKLSPFHSFVRRLPSQKPFHKRTSIPFAAWSQNIHSLPALMGKHPLCVRKSVCWILRLIPYWSAFAGTPWEKVRCGSWKTQRRNRGFQSPLPAPLL